MVKIHEFYCRGARVRIIDGEIEVLTDPAICHCPYVEATYGVRKIDRDAVRRIVEYKMKNYGYFKPNRCFCSELVVPFGSSEIISVCMKKGLLDCAIVVCEGAGSVISLNPDLVQGIGSRMNGLIRTSPISEIIKRIGEDGGIVLDPRTAKIDQLEATKRAIEEGFKKIAVTVICDDAPLIPKLRELERKFNVKLAIFSTCNTLIKENAVHYLEMADIVCSSASKLVREQIGPKALMQLGVSIPVFILTDFGKRLALEYLTEVKVPLVIFRSRVPYIVKEKLPKYRTECEECLKT